MRERLVLEGKYRLVSPIAQGSWAVCYKAEAVDNPEETVAVKCIPRTGLSPRNREVISGEATYNKAVSERHENILKFVGMEEDPVEDVLYVVTEFCTRGNLHRYAGKDVFCGKADLTKHIFLQILNGLKTMHENGVYHRDLKPDNIFIREDGNAVIGDFGFATNKPYTRNFGMGTAGYVAPGMSIIFKSPFFSLTCFSPEVYGGLHHNMTPWSSRHGDIWSLGIILLDMVVGRKSRLIWAHSNLSDPDFHYYYYAKKDYLLDLFDISHEANDIFKSIFEVNVHHRITLTGLGRRIEEIETFGSGAERSQANTKEIKAVAVAFLSTGRLMDAEDEEDTSTDPSTLASSTMLSSNVIVAPVPQKETPEKKSTPPSSISSADIGALPMESAEQRLKAPYRPPRLQLVAESSNSAKPAPSAPAPAAPPIRPPRVRPVEKAKTDEVPAMTTTPSSESGDDSDGPETPLTYAVDANADVAVAVEQDVPALDLAAEPTAWKPITSPAVEVEKAAAAKKTMPVLGKVHSWMRGTFSMPRPVKELRAP